MSRMVINEKWKNRICDEIILKLHPIGNENRVIDETTSFLPAVQWLIMQLAKNGIPFKLINLGAGVKRITTETNTCPCCKRKF